MNQSNLTQEATNPTNNHVWPCRPPHKLGRQRWSCPPCVQTNRVGGSLSSPAFYLRRESLRISSCLRIGLLFDPNPYTLGPNPYPLQESLKVCISLAVHRGPNEPQSWGGGGSYTTYYYTPDKRIWTINPFRVAPQRKFQGFLAPATALFASHSSRKNPNPKA